MTQKVSLPHCLLSPSVSGYLTRVAALVFTIHFSETVTYSARDTQQSPDVASLHCMKEKCPIVFFS